MTQQRRRRPLIQWVILLFLIGVVGFGLYLAKDNPNFDPGPIILGAMALIGLVVRVIFRVPEDDDTGGDGYGVR